MAAKNKFTLRTLSTLIGTFLMISPTGLYLFWGNLSGYTLSYFLITGTPASDVQSPWIMSVFLLAWAIMVPVSGYMTIYVGRRMTLILSIVIFNTSVAMSYYVIDKSFTVFTVMLGLFSGIGSGLSHGLLIEISVEWTDKYVGIVSMVIENGMNVGAAVINQFVTMYINPNYLTANWKIGPYTYYSQAEIIKRVPDVYVILGVISAVIQILGFCLIKEYNPKVDNNATAAAATAAVLKAEDDNDNNITSCILAKTEENDESRNILDGWVKVNVRDEELDNNKHSLKKVLTNGKFYVLWFSAAACEASILVIFNYYKQVGLTGIKDEDFLTSNGSATIVIIVSFSLIYGIVIDKFGVKTTFISLFSVLTVASSFYVLTPLLNKWIYVLTTILLMGWTSAMDDLFSPATVCVFGSEHFTINFGLIWSSCFLMNLGAPPAIAFILENFGWSFLFNSLAALNLVGLVTTVLVL